MHKLLGSEIIIINPCTVIVPQTMNNYYASIYDKIFAFHFLPWPRDDYFMLGMRSKSELISARYHKPVRYDKKINTD